MGCQSRKSRQAPPIAGGEPVPISAEHADTAFHCLYAEHGPALLRLATALTRDDCGRAEDHVRESMLRAWIHRNDLDIQHRSTRAWLNTIVRRLAGDAHRARQVRPREVQLGGDIALTGGRRPDDGIDDVGIRDAIATLPGPQRQVLAEIYYRGRSMAETARRLPIPPGRVRSGTFYGLRTLRRTLGVHHAVA